MSESESPISTHRAGSSPRERTACGNADLAGRGLPARFLAGYRAVDTAPVPEQVTTGYRHRVHDLAAILAEWEDPAVVTLTEEAGRVRRAAAEQVETELR
nr:DUF3987 domain-containing protein [Micromonospora fiedleri]